MTLFDKDIKFKDFRSLENALNYSFKNKDLLVEALSHPSLKQHSSKEYSDRNYERLEFFGDAILNFVVTETLFRKFSIQEEGHLAKFRAYMVCKDTLCKIATRLHLADYIIMTSGEESSGGRENPNNLENTMEALIAAIYLDSNIDVLKKIVNNLWGDFLSIKDLTYYDPKTALQEWAQSCGFAIPAYEVVKREGAAHSSIFTVLVKIKNYEQTGTGHSIKESEKDAARKLLQYLCLLN